MKKILNGLIVMALVFFFIVAFLNYSYYEGYAIIEKSEVVSIKKNNNEETNKEYVEELQEVAKDNNVDLIYAQQSIENRINSLRYYVTDNLGTYSDYSHKTNEDGSLMYPDIFSKSYIYDFSNTSNFSLDLAQFFVLGQSDDINNFIMDLENKSYEISQNEDGNLLLKPFLSFELKIMKTLLITIIIFTFLFYQISKSKKMMIRKLDGYAIKDTLSEDLVSFNKDLIGFIGIIFIFNLILFLPKIKGFIYYLPDLSIEILKYMCFYNFIFVITFLIIYFMVNIKELKNNFMGRKFYIFIYILKFGLILLLILFAVRVPSSISKYNNLKTEYLQLEKLYEYSYISTYVPGLVEDEKLEIDMEETMDDKMKEFYYATKDDLEGVLGYFELGEEEDLGYITGVVNDTYLENNKVYDINGDVINPDNFPDDKITYLIPKQYKGNKDIMEQIEGRREGYCEVGVNCFNYVYIENGSQFKLLNPDTIDMIKSTKSQDYIVDPIVSVISQDDIAQINQFGMYGDDMTAYISSQSYIVQTNFENPYEVVKPYIYETELENIIKETPLVSANKLDRIIVARNELIFFGISTILIFIALLISIYYLTRTHLKINNKKISLRVMNGESYNSIVKNNYIIMSIIYIIPFTMMAYLGSLKDVIILNGSYRLRGFDVFTPFIVTLFIIIIVTEILCIKVLFKNMIIKNMKGNINGDN